MQIAAILAAAGSSSRFSAAGGQRHKLDEDLGGKSVLQRSVELFSKHDLVRWIVVAAPCDDEALAAFRHRHGDKLSLLGATIVRGGPERSDSIAAALQAVPPEVTHIAVHDAARPCTPPTLLDAVFEAAADFGAAIPAVECSDTIKRVHDTGEPATTKVDPVAAILGAAPSSSDTLRVVESTVDRRGLVLAQTPQTFEASLLRRAYAQPDRVGTDDATLVERLGVRVAVVRGDPRNLKITTPDDLALARAILGTPAAGGTNPLRRF